MAAKPQPTVDLEEMYTDSSNPPDALSMPNNHIITRIEELWNQLAGVWPAIQAHPKVVAKIEELWNILKQDGQDYLAELMIDVDDMAASTSSVKNYNQSYNSGDVGGISIESTDSTLAQSNSYQDIDGLLDSDSDIDAANHVIDELQEILGEISTLPANRESDRLETNDNPLQVMATDDSNDDDEYLQALMTDDNDTNIEITSPIEDYTEQLDLADTLGTSDSTDQSIQTLLDADISSSDVSGISKPLSSDDTQDTELQQLLDSLNGVAETIDDYSTSSQTDSDSDAKQDANYGIAALNKILEHGGLDENETAAEPHSDSTPQQQGGDSTSVYQQTDDLVAQILNAKTSADYTNNNTKSESISQPSTAGDEPASSSIAAAVTPYSAELKPSAWQQTNLQTSAAHGQTTESIRETNGQNRQSSSSIAPLLIISAVIVVGFLLWAIFNQDDSTHQSLTSEQSFDEYDATDRYDSSENSQSLAQLISQIESRNADYSLGANSYVEETIAEQTIEPIPAVPDYGFNQPTAFATNAITPRDAETFPADIAAIESAGNTISTQQLQDISDHIRRLEATVVETIAEVRAENGTDEQASAKVVSLSGQQITDLIKASADRLELVFNSKLSQLSDRVSILESILPDLQQSMRRKGDDLETSAAVSRQQNQQRIQILKERVNKLELSLAEQKNRKISVNVIDESNKSTKVSGSKRALNAKSNRHNATIVQDEDGITIIINKPPSGTSNKSPSKQSGTTDGTAQALPKYRKIVHIVVKGDTLWDIAKRYVASPFMYPQLAKLNHINNPHLIYPGTKVRILQYLD